MIVSEPGNASLWYDHCPKLSKGFKKPFSLLFEKSLISPLFFGVTTEVIRFSKSAWSSWSKKIPSGCNYFFTFREYIWFGKCPKSPKNQCSKAYHFLKKLFETLILGYVVSVIKTFMWWKYQVIWRIFVEVRG